MTLVELLMAMSIMVLMIGAVATLVAFVARSSAPTSASAGQADNVALASAYWAEDVAGAQDFVYSSGGFSNVILTQVSSSGCSSSTPGTAFAWFFYQPLGSGTSYYTESVVYSYSGTTVTRTDCVRTPAHPVNLTNAYSGSGAPTIRCTVSGLYQSCTSRGTSSAVSLTLRLSVTSSQGVTVTTSPLLTGAWMLTSS
jgi:hypothetical protein